MEYNGDQCRLSSVFLCGFGSLPSGCSTKQEFVDQFSHPGVGDTASETVHDQESSISDCESVTCGDNSEQFRFSNNGLVRLVEGDKLHDLIRRRFISSLGSLGAQSTVVAIHRNTYSSVLGQARLQSFQIYSKAVERKCGGNANVKYAWYATASQDEISNIVSHGFDHCGKSQNNGLYGCGVCLAPDDYPMEW